MREGGDPDSFYFFLFLIVGDDFPVEGIDGLNLPNELDYVRISAVSYRM